jgi:predicted anti-sigma-YlaC factor YlaD
MMSKITCDIVKDIMPLYIDGVCSTNSMQMVENHIIECPDCKDLLESYRNPAVTDEIKTSNEKEFKELALKVKRKKAQDSTYSSGCSSCQYYRHLDIRPFRTGHIFTWK